MSQKAWVVDANNIHINEIDTKNLERQLVLTKEIREFLFSNNYKKNFIIGPKGSGKTYILKAKSQIVRDKEGKSFHYIPKTTLCERFAGLGVSLSKKDIESFNNLEIWTKLWTLAIYTQLVVYYAKEELPSPIRIIIGNAKRLSAILSALMMHRSKLVSLYAYIPTVLAPIVDDLQEYGIGQVAMFIDNIDEGFSEHTGYALYQAESGTSAISDKIWINAQLSLLKVVRDISANAKHIKIFLSIRSEAFNNNKSSLDLQYKDSAIKLSYDKEQIKNIFIKNILATEEEDLKNPSSKNPIKRFIGFDKIEHLYVVDKNDNKKKEDIFDFIYRHTFRRPREIVLMGKKITHIPVQKRTVENVRKVVNSVCYELFEQLKKEIIPYFKEDLFDVFIDHAKRNVINYQGARNIARKVENTLQIENNDYKHAFTYLWRIGLIGIVVENHNNYMKQQFQPVGEYVLNKELMIPHNDYFVLSPALNEKMYQTHGISFYDRFNIIGYDNRFNSERIKQQQIPHVHFGLDRDSLTLMLPELYNAKNLLIIQEPNNNWSCLQDASRFMISLQLGEQTPNEYPFDVIHDNNSKDTNDRKILDWQRGYHPLIIYSNNSKLIQKAIQHAQTLSLCICTSKSINHINTFIKRNEFKKDPSIKYFYEARKYFSKEDYITDRLHQAHTSLFKIEPVLIDRFEYKTNIPTTPHPYVTVKVSAEMYGTFICPDRENSTMQPSKVIIRTISNQFKFYVIRQLYLSEGVYQFYKILKQKGELFKSYKEKEELFRLFILIQVKRLIASRYINVEMLRVIFAGKSNNSIEGSLIHFGLKVAQRIDDLAKNYYSTSTGTIIDKRKLAKLKQLKIFPSHTSFYQHLSIQKLCNQHEMILYLKDLLSVKPNKKYLSVFISYSSKDSSFAKDISIRLSVLGISNYLYEVEENYGSLEDIMSQKVKEYQSFLFIASKNSLRSQLCHFELKKCREEVLENWEKPIIPVRIDDYILEVSKGKIPSEYRDEYWENILFLKEREILDFCRIEPGNLFRLHDAIVSGVLPVISAPKRKRSK